MWDVFQIWLISAVLTPRWSRRRPEDGPRPENSPPVLIALWALGESWGVVLGGGTPKWWEVLELAAQQQGTKGWGKQLLRGDIWHSLRHSFKCTPRRRGNVIQMFHTRAAYEYVLVYWNFHQQITPCKNNNYEDSLATRSRVKTGVSRESRTQNHWDIQNDSIQE